MVFDKDGALEQICGGKGYIDMSTVDADTSSQISEVGHSTYSSFELKHLTISNSACFLNFISLEESSI